MWNMQKHCSATLLNVIYSATLAAFIKTTTETAYLLDSAAYVHFGIQGKHLNL